MKLRELEMKDVPLMLEWMHDPSVVENLRTDFMSKTIEDCERFILTSNDDQSINLAIVDETDQYQGTVSLRDIEGGAAEFAITVRASAMGKGYSKWAMDEIMRKGFDELGLTLIYWCVSPDNKRAIRFYDKNGFKRVSSDQIEDYVKDSGYTTEQVHTYVWYAINRYMRLLEN